MNYPTSLDNGTSLPNPTGSNTQNNPDHAALHTSENAAIIAAETKLGTGSSTPASNTLLIGNGAGTSAWSALTSAQLAAVLSDETGSGAAVFANTPTLITPKVDTINESTGDNGVTVGGVSLKAGVISTNNAVPTAAIADSAVTTAKINAAAVTAAKMAFGMVRQRKGGSSGDATWITSGTTSTDTSAKAVFIQVGTIVGNGSGVDVAITFPVAYNFAPIVIVGTMSTTAANMTSHANTITTTGFNARGVGGTGVELIGWLAIGQ